MSVSNPATPSEEKWDRILPRLAHEGAEGEGVGARRAAREAMQTCQCRVYRQKISCTAAKTYTEGGIDRSLRLGAGGRSKSSTPCAAVLDAVYGCSPAASPARRPARADLVAFFNGHWGEKEEEKEEAGFCCVDAGVSTERERGPRPSHAIN